SVIGGLRGASGWLMVPGAGQVITDMQLPVSNIHALLSPASLSKLTAAAALVVSLYFALRRLGNPLVLLGLIFAGIVAAHLAFFAAGISITHAHTARWLFQTQSPVRLTPPCD